jgi:hypothetical protein
VFTFEELHAEREKLLKLHASVKRSWKSRLARKWERLAAMARNPVLIGDWIEIQKRRTAFKKRVRAGEWRDVFDRRHRDVAALQVPSASFD